MRAGVCAAPGLGFEFRGTWFRIWGLGCGVWILGWRLMSRIKVECLVFRVQEFSGWISGFRVNG